MTRRRIKESKPSNHWIGTRLARLRRMRNMTQQDVGDILHRTDSAISDIENGYSDITLDHLLRLAEGLKIPAAGLLLPDPGATAGVPFKNGGNNAQVVDLLTHEQKRQLLGQIFEHLPRLSLDQLSGLLSHLEHLAQEKSSAA
jgi:transcriptional regulator with XRE-family HTH domain